MGNHNSEGSHFTTNLMERNLAREGIVYRGYVVVVVDGDEEGRNTSSVLSVVRQLGS